MAVPFFTLGLQHGRIRKELDAAVSRVLDSGQFVLGPEMDGFEAEFAASVGSGHAICMSSGTDALLVGLQALGVGPGSEVVTTPFTFFATAAVIVRLGARPVFVDIEPDGFLMDVAAAEAAVTGNTGAIVPVHLFGQCADMAAIKKFAGGRGVAVLEDAAQAVGATFDSAQAGTMGEVGAFSFFPTKNLGGLGDGGAIVTDDAKLATLMRSLRVHGQGDTYYHEHVGINGRLDALQAALLRAKLPWLDSWNEARRENARRYRAMFEEAGLDDIVTLPLEHPRRHHVYHNFVIRAPKRDELRGHLSSAGIGANVYYPLPLHLQPCFKQLGYGKGAFPVSELASQEVLALPIYPELTEEQQAEVVSAIRRFYEG